MNSNMGNHHPDTPITKCSIQERMDAYDNLPRNVRDAHKDVPVKMETVRTAAKLAGGVKTAHVIFSLKESAHRFYLSSVEDAYL